MEKDFAPRQRKTKKAAVTTESPAIAYCFWLLLGMVIGCGSTFSFLYYRQAHKLTTPPPQVAVVNKVKKVDKPIRNKPQFDFYTMLPAMQMEVAKKTVEKSPSKSAKVKTTPAQSARQYFLQIAAYNRAADAEAMKLKLLVMGYKASVQTAKNANQKTINRVWVGPFNSINQAQTVKKQLNQKHYDSILLSLSNIKTTNP